MQSEWHRFACGARAALVRIELAEAEPAARGAAGAAGRHALLRSGLGALGLDSPRPVLVSVGGADGLDPLVGEALQVLFRDHLLPRLEQLGAAVIDGGTASGVMALMGRARRARRAALPLLGVAAAAKVRRDPAQEASPGDAVALDPGHSHFLLVPGRHWGDEVPWMAAAATALAGGGSRGLTLVCGGGAVTRQDIAASLAARRPVLRLLGTGGAADAPGPASGSGLESTLPLAEAAARLPHLVAAALTGGAVPGAPAAPSC